MSKRNVAGQGSIDRTNSLSAEERDGIRIGARVRFREAAKEALETAADVAAATGAPIDWQSHWTNRETGEAYTLAEARELLEAAPPRYAPIMNRERMADRDLWTIGTAAASATAAAINRKAARSARLSEEEYDELRAWILAEAVTAGAPRWRAIEGNAEAEAAAGTATRAAEPSTLRGRWIGYLILRGRTWRAERAERMARESDEAGHEPADTDALAAAEVAEVGATVEAVAARLEAAGAPPLGKAERLTLEAALLGVSRRELAERYGHSADYVKLTLRRGRAALAERWDTAADARREFAGIARRTLEAERAALTGRERVADVLRWIGEAPSMVGAEAEAAWRAPMAAPNAAAAERVPLPRRARGLLPVRPQPLGLLPLPWHARREAALAASELREAVAEGTGKRPAPTRSERTAERPQAKAARTRQRNATAERQRAAAAAALARRLEAASIAWTPGEYPQDLAAYIG
jgi:hypothetical protein